MRLYILIATLLFVFPYCYGQGDTLSPEQQRLEYLQGKWTIDGSETTYVEVCDFIQGNHLQCISNSTEDKTDNTISYLSYSTLEGIYIYYGLYGSGNSRSLRGYWIEDRFVFEGQRKTAEHLVKWRVTMRPTAGKIDFLEESSTDNGAWKESAKFQYKRVVE
jgi:hypothetical protein